MGRANVEPTVLSVYVSGERKLIFGEVSARGEARADLYHLSMTRIGISSSLDHVQDLKSREIASLQSMDELNGVLLEESTSSI